jgi:hypothetical protein
MTAYPKIDEWHKGIYAGAYQISEQCIPCKIVDVGTQQLP